MLIGLKPRATYSTKHMQNLNQLQLGRVLFPALIADHVYMLRAAIGLSSPFLVTPGQCNALLLCFWHSHDNRS